MIRSKVDEFRLHQNTITSLFVSPLLSTNTLLRSSRVYQRSSSENTPPHIMVELPLSSENGTSPVVGSSTNPNPPSLPCQPPSSPQVSHPQAHGPVNDHHGCPLPHLAVRYRVLHRKQAMMLHSPLSHPSTTTTHPTPSLSLPPLAQSRKRICHRRCTVVQLACRTPLPIFTRSGKQPSWRMANRSTWQRMPQLEVHYILYNKMG